MEHTRRTEFAYEGFDCPIYNPQELSWKHLNLFQHECYIYCRIPRVKTPHDKVKIVEVPWAMLGSSFTLLSEYNLLDLMPEGMSASSAGRYTGISGKSIFQIVNRHVGEALSDGNLHLVNALSVDEANTLFDREAKKVVGIATGKSQDAFNQALLEMEVRGADREDVRSVTMGKSRFNIAGVSEGIPQLDIVFDGFFSLNFLTMP